MKSVGWVMRLVGGSCPGSGVAVKVTAPVMGPLSCTTSSNVPPIAWGLLNVTATRTPLALTTALGGSSPNPLAQASRKAAVSHVWASRSGLSVKASISSSTQTRVSV